MAEYSKIELDLSEIERLASLGLNLGQVAQALGVSRSTLDRRREENDELDTAYFRGRAKGVEEIASVLKSKAMQGDVMACKLYLNSVGEWSKKVSVEHKEAPTLTIVLQQ